MNAADEVDRYALSPQQRAAWPGRDGAAAGAVLLVDGPLQPQQLAAAIEAAVQAHEILRTQFELHQGLPVQTIAAAGPGALHWRLEALPGGQHWLELRTTVLHADAASLLLLADEIAARCAGAPEPPAPPQYADYAAWAHARSQAADLAEGQAHWSRLPAASSSETAASDEGGKTHRITLMRAGPPVAEADALLAWLLLWQARGGSVPIALGVDPRSHQRAWARLLGPLQRWLPIRGDLPAGLTLNAALDSVAQRLHEAATWQDCWPSDAPPVAEAAFAYDPAHPGVQAGALRFTLQRSWRDEPRFGLQLSVRAGSLASELELVCDPARWPPAEAERLLAQYAALLARPRPAGDAALRDWLAGTPPLPASGPPACGPGLLQRLQLFAALQPDAPALHCAGQTLSYGELMRRAGALSACLTDMLGACTEARVGIHLDRSAQALVALLGVLGAGATAVPLDPALPSARLAAQAARCRLRLVLSLRAHEPLPTAAVPVLWLDELTAPEPRPFVTPHPQQLAYILQTSGSTGTPKGVAVPHGALSHYADALLARLAPAPGAMWEMVTPLVVDLGWSSLLGAWCSGGTLCLRSADEASDPRRVGGADYLKITPTHLQALLAGAQQPAQVLPRRGLLLGGEAPPAALLETLAALAPQLPVYNHYGPTETTIGVVMGRLAVPPEPGQRPALGLPLDRVACSLLETGLHPVLDGALGSLWLGGPGLARGYLDDPAATAERFRPDPFAGTPGARCYDSGDLARRRADGQLEFHGRRDRQLKLRGHRIEPAEIETVLRRHPAVGQAAVVLLHEPQPALAAYLVPAGEDRPPLAALRQHAESWLPAWMVPAHVVWIGALPLTPSGKLDTAALPRALPTTSNPAAEAASPQGELEQTLAAIWRAVLAREHIGVHDNFFHLGGDSIASIQVVARASQAGVQVTPRQLFEHPTLRELAAMASRIDAAPAPPARAGRVPLTPIQHAFFELHAPEPHHYNQALWLEAASPLDLDALRSALQVLPRQHAALRLRFRPTLNGWQQTLHDTAAPVPLDVLDLPGAAGEGWRAALQAQVDRTQAGLDLVHGPLLRALVCRDGGGAADRMLLVVHHLVVDTVSWGILLEDLQRAYRQTCEGTPVSLAAPTASFAAWAEHLEALAHGLAATRERDEWLSPARAQAPGDTLQAVSPALHDSLRHMQLRFSAGQMRALSEGVCPAFGVQLQEALLAVLLDAHTRWSGEPRLLVDLESHGRDGGAGAPDVARTVGWFTVRCPVLLDASSAADPGALLAGVKETLRRLAPRARNHGLLRWAAGDPALSADLRDMPQPGVSFNFLGRVQRRFPPGSPFVAFSEEHGGTRAGSTPARWHLDVNASLVDGCLELSWAYDPARDRDTAMAALATELQQALDRLVDYGSAQGAGRYTPSDFPAARLQQDDLDRLLADWQREFS